MYIDMYMIVKRVSRFSGKPGTVPTSLSFLPYCDYTAGFFNCFQAHSS